jgi:hypothetical protein
VHSDNMTLLKRESIGFSSALPWLAPLFEINRRRMSFRRFMFQYGYIYIPFGPFKGRGPLPRWFRAAHPVERPVLIVRERW